MVTVIAPGINVYSMGADKAKSYYEVLKEYSEPFLALGLITRGNPEEGYHAETDIHVRSCKVFSTNSLNSCHESDPLRVMMGCAQEDMDVFVENFRLSYQMQQVLKNHDLTAMRYEQGEFFVHHNDDSAKHPRTISAIMYFNNDYEGGELEFKHFNIKYSPKSGDCIIFSAAFPYMHRVNTVTKGTRYAAVNWYKYI